MSQMSHFGILGLPVSVPDYEEIHEVRGKLEERVRGVETHGEGSHRQG